MFRLILLLVGLTHEYSITSATMHPTLMRGDTVTARNIHLYQRRDLGTPALAVPRRGDIVVHARDGETFPRRLVGLPGDTVQLRDGRLFVNGEMAARRPLGSGSETTPSGAVVPVTVYEETLPGGPAYAIQEVSDHEWFDNTPAHRVPEASYFVLADSRDLAADSRMPTVGGYVAADAVVALIRAAPPPSGVAQ